MRQCRHGVAHDSRLGFGTDHRVDDGLLRCLHGGFEQGSVSGLRVAYREGDEDIFRSVAGRRTAPYRSGLAIGRIEDELLTTRTETAKLHFRE